MNLPPSISKTIRALQSRKQREKLGLALVEGSRSVLSVLDGGVDIRYLVFSDKYGENPDPSVQTVLTRTSGHASVYTVSESEFSNYSDVENAQGVLAVVSTNWRSEEEALGMRRIVALDGVQDPGNAGAIIRTAAWYGIDAIVAGSGTVDLFAPKVLRASMGGIWDIAVIRASDLAAFLRRFKDRGGSIYSAEMEGVRHTDWRPAPISAVVFGNEGNGLSLEIGLLVPEPVTIARRGVSRSVESLNVGVAGGILIDRWMSASQES